MSDKLAAIKPKDLIRALNRIGFEVDHQTGSHAVLYRESDHRRVVVVVHNRDLGVGLLARILADAGLTKDEFRKLI